MSNNAKNIQFENARLIYRNFQGKQTTYNPEGNRNFCVIIDDVDFAHRLKDDGWNVKFRDPREEEDKEFAYLQVSVSYRNIPPTIHLISSGNNVILDEDAVGMLDWADIVNVDMVVNPYHWSVNGKSGIKAYLKSMYVTIETDPFEAKYSNTAQDDIPF